MKVPYRLFCGDCLEKMKKIPSGYVDLVLCDPPYGTTALKWDSIIPLEPMWELLKRLIKPNASIVLIASQPFTSVLVTSNMKMFKYCWVWQKNRYGNFIMASRQPIKEHEDVVVFSLASSSTTGKIKMVYNPQHTGEQLNKKQEYKEAKNNLDRTTKTTIGYNLKRNRNKGAFPKSIITCPFDGTRLHPTQKPVALMEYLIKTYTNEGETVLDFTMGSGTTGIACCNLNRSFIGIELDKGYFDIASKRIADHQASK